MNLNSSNWPGGMRGAWLDSLRSKNSNKNSKISKTVQTCSDPSGGGGLPPPRGNTAARPAIHYCASGEAFFVFIDLCDICNIDMRNCLGDSVGPSLLYVVEALGSIFADL